MKRSVGVTVMASVFLLIGVYGLVQAGYSLAIVPQTFEKLQQLQESQTSSDSRNADTVSSNSNKTAEMDEETKRFMMGIKRVLTELNVFVSSREFRSMTFRLAIFKVLMSILLIICGVGCLRLRSWARPLIFVYVGLSVLMWAWAYYSFQALGVMDLFRSIMDEVSTFAPEFANYDLYAQFAIWGGLAIAVAWMGFILWFFNRSSVKAQFRQAQETV